MSENIDPTLVTTGISLTPRILAGMLTGGNTLGVNWAAKFANISDLEVPAQATQPVITHKLPGGGDDILAALLPPQILGDITEHEDIDDVRDGLWKPELLDRVTEGLVTGDGSTVEEIYERCANLMHGADLTNFYWDANYIIHRLAVENLDNAYVRKVAEFFKRFGDSDPTGGLFALFMLALLGPEHFDRLVDRLSSML